MFRDSVPCRSEQPLAGDQGLQPTFCVQIVDASAANAADSDLHTQVIINPGHDSKYLRPNRKMTALAMSEGGSSTVCPRIPKSLDSVASRPKLEQKDHMLFGQTPWCYEHGESDVQQPEPDGRDTILPGTTVPNALGTPGQSDPHDNRPAHAPVDEQQQVKPSLMSLAEWNALTAADDVTALAADTETVSRQQAATESFFSAASGDEGAGSSSEAAQRP
jgi:hypothetical protein